MQAGVPQFLTLEDVLLLHRESIARYGGSDGVRDAGLLESALAQPSSAFAGEYLHPDVPSMAAAYLYHIAKNHPFVDGNKRTAALASFAFLRLNGWDIDASEDEYQQLVLGIAAGQASKDDAVAFFRAHTVQA